MFSYLTKIDIIFIKQLSINFSPFFVKKSSFLTIFYGLIKSFIYIQIIYLNTYLLFFFFFYSQFWNIMVVPSLPWLVKIV